PADIFLLSSRRRHTRSKRDWSSDVCSSDLRTALPTRYADFCKERDLRRFIHRRSDPQEPKAEPIFSGWTILERKRIWHRARSFRSEERRVGKGRGAGERAGAWRGERPEGQY